MNAFDYKMETMLSRRQAQKENQINAYLCARLGALSKEQVLKELTDELTFIVGVGDVFSQNQAINARETVFF